MIRGIDMTDLMAVKEDYRQGIAAGKAGIYCTMSPDNLQEARHKAVAGIVNKYEGDINTVLDIGCGLATVRKLLKVSNYTGVDILEELVAKSGMNLNQGDFVYPGEIQETPAALKEYDLVMSCGVLSHYKQEDVGEVLLSLIKYTRKYILVESQNSRAYRGRYNSHDNRDLIKFFEEHATVLHFTYYPSEESSQILFLEIMK